MKETWSFTRNELNFTNSASSYCKAYQVKYISFLLSKTYETVELIQPLFEPMFWKWSRRMNKWFFNSISFGPRQTY